MTEYRNYGSPGTFMNERDKYKEGDKQRYSGFTENFPVTKIEFLQSKYILVEEETGNKIVTENKDNNNLRIIIG